MKTLLINDLHLGVKRQGGTTKSSRKDLEEWMLGEFEELLIIPHDQVIIVGDLFDKRNVEEHIMRRVIDALRNETCTIVAGNHDIQGINDHTMSSAQFVAEMSGSLWIDRAGKHTDFYIIPHVFDQETFDREVEKIPEDSKLLIHANIDSTFAHSDHSLNLSGQQIRELRAKNVHIISGHEHAPRESGNVTVLGNQFPSSIADCLGGDKFAWVYEDGTLTPIKTWGEENFVRVGWSRSAIPEGDFIRIEGTCSPEEFVQVNRRVANLRKKSEAFIIKNDVKVDMVEIEIGSDEVDKFNIINLFMDQLSPNVRKKVERVV